MKKIILVKVKLYNNSCRRNETYFSQTRCNDRIYTKFYNCIVNCNNCKSAEYIINQCQRETNNNKIETKRYACDEKLEQMPLNGYIMLVLDRNCSEVHSNEYGYARCENIILTNGTSYSQIEQCNREKNYEKTVYELINCQGRIIHKENLFQNYCYDYELGLKKRYTCF